MRRCDWASLSRATSAHSTEWTMKHIAAQRSLCSVACIADFKNSVQSQRLAIRVGIFLGRKKKVNCSQLILMVISIWLLSMHQYSPCEGFVWGCACACSNTDQATVCPPFAARAGATCGSPLKVGIRHCSYSQEGGIPIPPSWECKCGP